MRLAPSLYTSRRHRDTRATVPRQAGHRGDRIDGDVSWRRAQLAHCRGRRSSIPTNCARWLATQRRSSAYAANAWTALLGSAGIGCNQVPARSSMVPTMAQTAPILFSRTRTLSWVKRRRRPYPARAVSCASTLFTAGRSDMRLRWSCTLEKRDDSRPSASIHRARVKR